MKAKAPFPRRMWADHDPECRVTPVAIYPRQSEQRSNRPDLPAIPVLVIALPTTKAQRSGRMLRLTATIAELDAMLQNAEPEEPGWRDAFQTKLETLLPDIPK